MSNRRATGNYAKDATVYLETGEDKRKAMEASWRGARKPNATYFSDKNLVFWRTRLYLALLG
jgi:hypothetical protein